MRDSASATAFLPSYSSIKKPGQNLGGTDHNLGGRTHDLGGNTRPPSRLFVKAEEEFLRRKDIRPTDKLVKLALEAIRYRHGDLIMASNSSIGDACGISKSAAGNSVDRLIVAGICMRAGVPVGQVQPLELCDKATYGQGAQGAPVGGKPAESVCCSQCARKLTRLPRSGLCRECVQENKMRRVLEGLTGEVDYEALSVTSHFAKRALKLRRVHERMKAEQERHEG